MKITEVNKITTWLETGNQRHEKIYALEVDPELYRIKWGSLREVKRKRTIHYNLPISNMVYCTSFTEDRGHVNSKTTRRTCTGFSIHLKSESMTLQESIQNRQMIVPPLPNISVQGTVCFQRENMSSFWDNIIGFRSQGDNRDYFFDTVKNPLWIELAHGAGTRVSALRKIFTYWEGLSFENFNSLVERSRKNNSYLNSLSNKATLNSINMRETLSFDPSYLKIEKELVRNEENINFEDLVKI